MKLAVVLLLTTYIGISASEETDPHQLIEEYSWDIVDYEFPPNRREQALASGSYIPNLNGIFSLGAWRNKMFVGVHRFRAGTLSSLNYFPLDTTSTSPVLIPYPSFDANYVNEDPNNLTVSLPSESSVINAGHFKIDKCDRLWTVDVGYTDFWGAKRVIAPPALVIFDLNADTLIRRFVIPEEFVTPASVLLSLAVDIEGDSCDDTHAYIVDMQKSIIVYSFKKNSAWQVDHDYMAPEPSESRVGTHNTTFKWYYGVYAIAVGEIQDNGSKDVYFAPLASTKMYSVSNRILQDESYTEDKYYNNFHLLGSVSKRGNAAQMEYDYKTNVLINLLFSKATITCWNTHAPYKINLVHKTKSVFHPTAVNIDADRNLWVLLNQLVLYFYKNYEEGVKGMRIMKQTFDGAIQGTKCVN